ncbi:MAG TPA: hypothetical protein VM287_04560, partial [Egibacteraceae bacterium]|nr:hypothetical protein [Egibacteraceae bacterium]
PRRVVLYSHDTLGLGHVRRNLAIAGAFVRGEPRPDILLISGVPAARADPASRVSRLGALPGRGRWGSRRADREEVKVTMPLSAASDER